MAQEATDFMGNVVFILKGGVKRNVTSSTFNMLYENQLKATREVCSWTPAGSDPYVRLGNLLEERMSHGLTSLGICDTESSEPGNPH